MLIGTKILNCKNMSPKCEILHLQKFLVIDVNARIVLLIKTISAVVNDLSWLRIVP